MNEPGEVLGEDAFRPSNGLEWLRSRNRQIDTVGRNFPS
jgi:hypothetical protein